MSHRPSKATAQFDGSVGSSTLPRHVEGQSSEAAKINPSVGRVYMHASVWILTIVRCMRLLEVHGVVMWGV